MFAVNSPRILHHQLLCVTIIIKLQCTLVSNLFSESHLTFLTILRSVVVYDIMLVVWLIIVGRFVSKKLVSLYNWCRNKGYGPPYEAASEKGILPLLRDKLVVSTHYGTTGEEEEKSDQKTAAPARRSLDEERSEKASVVNQ